MGKPRPALAPGPYLVAGLARSGTAAALALRRRGEEVIGWDTGPAADPALAQAAERLSGAGVELHLDAPGEALAAVSRAGTLIKSPGVPFQAPVVQAAREAGIPVLGELELAWRLIPNEFVAVTGTNGKTTTTEWIGQIHREAGEPVAVAGNVGTAVSTLIDAIEPDTTVVCESSSFQLEDTTLFSPEVALLLNLGVDHLDRHGTVEAYVAAKLRIFANQDEDDVAVVPPGMSVASRAAVLHYGQGPEAELADAIRLPGEHNRRNGMAAACVCLARGIQPEAVAAGLSSFRGVAHRLETIATADGVRWVNDSKATNVESTLVALSSFDGAVHLIAGGRAKGEDFSALASTVAERCAAVYLIGEAADELEAALAPAGVPLEHTETLERAVADAHMAAQPGDTVLFSPACASYDQYRDFEARGDHFRALVQAL